VGARCPMRFPTAGEDMDRELESRLIAEAIRREDASEAETRRRLAALAALDREISCEQEQTRAEQGKRQD
jgi:hypothetical protein